MRRVAPRAEVAHPYTRPVTLLCVPILVRDPAFALSEAENAKLASADIVEFRVDEFFDPEAVEADPDRQKREIARLVSESPLPCIVTCRSAKEGGGYSGSEEDRLSLYERLGASSGKGSMPPRYLDIEFASASEPGLQARLAHLLGGEPTTEQRSGLILSAHDFLGRPADLTRRVLALRADGFANVLKVAYRARSIRDNLELFEILRDSDRPMIALGMGEFGLMSRILAPKFGGFLTFASLRPESVTAPGQPTVAELLGLYRFRSIRRTTKVFGVIGWPVGHSMSPLVHNAVFSEHRFDGVYLPLPVPSTEGIDAEATFASFKATLSALIEDPLLDFAGASVTIPHKENLFRFALERLKSEPGIWSLDAISLATGAGNSLALTREGGQITRARVFNTDVPAAIAPLRSVIGSLEGKSIAVVGAGGVGRAIAFGLAHAGANVTVFNRSLPRAEELARSLSKHLSGRGIIRAEAWEALSTMPLFDAYINCTPLGMSGGPDPSGIPVPIEKLVLAASNSGNNRSASVVLDTVYNPVETPLIKAARRAGWTAIDGVTMFIEQAALQSEAWTVCSGPRQLMDRLVRSRLSSAAK